MDDKEKGVVAAAEQRAEVISAHRFAWDTCAP